MGNAEFVIMCVMRGIELSWKACKTKLAMCCKTEKKRIFSVFFCLLDKIRNVVVGVVKK